MDRYIDFYSWGLVLLSLLPYMLNLTSDHAWRAEIVLSFGLTYIAFGLCSMIQVKERIAWYEKTYVKDMVTVSGFTIARFGVPFEIKMFWIQFWHTESHELFYGRSSLGLFWPRLVNGPFILYNTCFVFFGWSAKSKQKSVAVVTQ